MLNKNSILVIAFTLCLLMAFTATSVMGSEMTIRLSNAGPADEEDRTYIANDIFKQVVETGTDGRITVETYHASELADERETYEGMIIGTIEMGTLTTGPLPGFFEDILVLDIPYLFDSAPVAWEVMRGPFGEKMNERIREETGIIPLAWADHGFRHFTNDVRPVEEPSDMEGLTIRTMENPAHMEMVRALGADPTPMAFGELYLGLEQGVVDGQETPITLIKNMGFYEVQDYLVLDGHLYNYLGIFISEEVYNSLSEADQRVIREAAQIWEKVQTGYSRVQIERGVAELEEAGMHVTHLSPEKLEAFREATQGPVIEYLEEEIGREIIDEIFEAIEEAKANI